MDYLSNLNDKQKEAVLATDGPVLVVAGAGAGKTKTLTSRIMHLLKNGVLSRNILAITFTNKAGREMRERVYKMLEEDYDLFLKNGKQMPFISTFHSLGVNILKENAEILGFPRHFNILDKSDSKKIIKKAMEELGIEPKEHLDKVCSIISAEKSRGVSFSDYNEKQLFDYSSEITKKVWKIYEDTKNREKSFDFDDLLLKTLHLLKKNKEIAEYYQNLWQYIHIDEYQDTNKVQDEIVEILTTKHQNIFAVGDTDQSIYGWRGADIKNMLHFEKRYPNTKIILLEQNYRSTKTILKVANQIIENNEQRIPKNLFTDNTEGENVSVFEGFNEGDEAYFVAERVKKIIADGIKPEDIAVLYRANFQSRILEESFLAYGVKYQMLGTKFFERKEIKDCVAYIKAGLNTENKSDFLRIINTPVRGIGKTSIEKIEMELEHDLPVKTQEKIASVRGILLKIKEYIKANKVSDSIRFVIEISGLKKELEESKKEEDFDRFENLMELVSLAKNYDENIGEVGMENFLTDVSLLTDEEEMKKESGGVKLMTVHSAKGLEFKVVFIVGLEEDLFPHKGWGERKKDKSEEEEERRLFYVAVTRAKEKLYLSYAISRTIFGERKINSPSRFLEEISDEHKDFEKKSMLTPKKGTYFSIDF